MDQLMLKWVIKPIFPYFCSNSVILDELWGVSAYVDFGRGFKSLNEFGRLGDDIRDKCLANLYKIWNSLN